MPSLPRTLMRPPPASVISKTSLPSSWSRSSKTNLSRHSAPRTRSTRLPASATTFWSAYSLSVSKRFHSLPHLLAAKSSTWMSAFLAVVSETFSPRKETSAMLTCCEPEL